MVTATSSNARNAAESVIAPADDRLRRLAAAVRRAPRGARRRVVGSIPLVLSALAAAEAAASAAAEALPDGFVAIEGLEGVVAHRLLADGRVELTLEDGSVLLVASEDVQVGPDGQLLVAEAAVAGLGADGGASLLLVAAGGGAVLLGTLAASGDDGAAPVPAPVDPDPAPAPAALASSSSEEAEDTVAFASPEAAVEVGLEGTEFNDSFVLDLPNAEEVTLSGDLKGLDDKVMFQIADADPAGGEVRELSLQTDVAGSGAKLVFAFADEKDRVVLREDSSLGGFDELEVVRGQLDVTRIDTTAIGSVTVNSTIVVSLEQLRSLDSVVSVTGHGEVIVALESAEEVPALLEFLAAAPDAEFVLIGATLSAEVAGEPLAGAEAEQVAAAAEAIVFPAIPELSEQVEGLEGAVAGLRADDETTGETLLALAERLALVEAQAVRLGELVGDVSVAELVGALEQDLAAVEGALRGEIDALAALLETEVNALSGDLDMLEAGDPQTLVGGRGGAERTFEHGVDAADVRLRGRRCAVRSSRRRGRAARWSHGHGGGAGRVRSGRAFRRTEHARGGRSADAGRGRGGAERTGRDGVGAAGGRRRLGE